MKEELFGDTLGRVRITQQLPMYRTTTRFVKSSLHEWSKALSMYLTLFSSSTKAACIPYHTTGFFLLHS
jgi:hypothetical protein